MRAGLFFVFHVLLFIQFLPNQALSQILPLDPQKIRKAMDLEQQAISQKDSLMLAEAYYLYGKAYEFTGDATTSQKYFLRSLTILEPRGDSFELGRIYCRLSENTRLLSYDNAVKYLQLALGIFERIGSAKGQVIAYGKLGQWHDSKGTLSNNKALRESALRCYKKVESLSKKLNDSLAIGEANLQLAAFYYNDNVKAIHYLEEALRFLTVKRSKRAKLTAMLTLSKQYIETDQLKRASEMLAKVEHIYRQGYVPDIQVEHTLNLVLIQYYEHTNKWKEALSQYKQYHEKEQLKFRAERDAVFLKLQTEYETGKKEALLTAQKKEIGINKRLMQAQRNFLSLTIVLLILAIVMSIIFFQISRKNQRISKKNKQLVREQNHRVKNNLQMISSLLSMQSRLLIDPNAKAAIQESRLRVQSMSIIQRKLYDSDNLSAIYLPDFIPELTEMVLLACGYEEAEQSYHIDPVQLDVDRTISLGLILTEVIINACKYAFPCTSLPLLTVECKQTDKEIALTIKDNGPGLGAAVIEQFNASERHFKRNTFGMQLLELQVSQLYGSFEFRDDKGALFTMKFRK